MKRIRESENALSPLEHLDELRRRGIKISIGLLLGIIGGYCLYPLLIPLVLEPINKLNQSSLNTLYLNTLPEGFLTRLKLAFTAGTVLCGPYILFQILRFIFPGLTLKEKRILLLILPVSAVTAIASVIYGYLYLLPLSLQFLQGQGFIPEGVGVLLNYSRSIEFFTGFLTGAMLMFQLPIGLFLLLAFKIVSFPVLLKITRPLIIIIFLLSAILTPPDLISQIGVAFPVLALYGLTLAGGGILHLGLKNTEYSSQHKKGKKTCSDWD